MGTTLLQNLGVQLYLAYAAMVLIALIWDYHRKARDPQDGSAPLRMNPLTAMPSVRRRNPGSRANLPCVQEASTAGYTDKRP
jgi:hypothetical protein